MAKLRFENVSKSFGSTKVVERVNLEIRSGEFMVIVGPSGCGKSTLLRLIAGLENISSGDLYFDEERVNHVAPSKRGVSMVFQSYALYPHMTVRDNMAFGLKLARTEKRAVEKRVNNAADLLGIGHLLDRLPKQLSGGQRQRVAIGRAIVRDPRVFLFDEPLSNLDASLRVKTRVEIAKLHQSMKGTTMVYVTHDQIEAMTMADRICVLRDGLIEQVGTPMDLYESPQTLFVAGFVGSPKMNMLTGELAEKFEAQTIGVRGEHIITDEAHPLWRGKVVHRENLGADSLIYVDIGAENPLVVREAGKTSAVPGQILGFSVAPEKVYRFDEKGLRLQSSK